VYNVTNTTWVENSITWNNKPAAQTTILATTNVAGTANQYYEWDITQQVAAARNAGLDFITLKLLNVNTTNNQVLFNSKEAAANRPELVVTHSGAGLRLAGTSDNNIEQNSIAIYPNPAKGMLTIHNSSGVATLKLYDLKGRLLRQRLIGRNEVQQIPVRDLKNGLYLIRIQSEKGILTKKIVIEN